MQTTFRTKISIWRILSAVFLLTIGLLPFLLPNHSENNPILNFLPLILFGTYAAYLLLCFFTTFTLSNEDLLIKSFSGTIVIPYTNITAVTTRKINPFFRYGYIKGYIRKETATHVILISYMNETQKQITIMLSPQNQNTFLAKLSTLINI
ncbi:hypothetical protein [Culicoidibacter larvae]|uniref:PH domain-containing protein n=1 Tax=Culicoidibacter larvae TaxID=2579976 RepID=A0A5R8QAI2_9FIRM|nr:hypothetical protein [Culicoidibacter larvae]TLG72116.1 hypothetical protein FEZ08_09805 [Culicoidibacter larvae]